ncbi:hypothetical protein X975_25713, partial [Stegodyphus mimosarum]
MTVFATIILFVRYSFVCNINSTNIIKGTCSQFAQLLTFSFAKSIIEKFYNTNKS